MKTPLLRDQFLAYCTAFTYNHPRKVPINHRTIERYLRGLILVEKIIGHNLQKVSEKDQLVFMDKIMEYKQGTRRVSTQIFQRYIAWGIKNDHFSCQNMIKGHEDTIIGEHTPPSYTYLTKRQVRTFFNNLVTPQLRAVFGLIYYGGLTTSEVATVRKDQLSKRGVLVYRAVRNESQVVALPTRFINELIQYAEDRDEFLFDLKDNYSSRLKLNTWYKQATLESKVAVGTTVRDLRTSGIRHFYEECKDIELTREYAGVDKYKKGWIDSLTDTSSYYRRTIAEARGYYGKSKKLGPDDIYGESVD
jgi:integrase